MDFRETESSFRGHDGPRPVVPEVDQATALYRELLSLRDDDAGNTACSAALVGSYGELARAKVNLLRRVRPQQVTTADDMLCWVLRVAGTHFIVYYVDPVTAPRLGTAFTLSEAIPDIFRGDWCADEKVLAERVAIDVVVRLLQARAAGVLS